jgi:serine/threonine protein kinase
MYYGFLKELDSFREIKGENILKLAEFFFDGPNITIITEFMERGSLRDV